MRTPFTGHVAARPLAIASLAMVGLAAGCAQGPAGPTTTPSASAPGAPSGPTSGTPGTGPAASGAPVASCVVGDWQGTGTSGQAATNGASATISGGEGIRLTVRQGGQASVDFTGMRPATFTVTVGGAEVSGQFTYAGTASGTVRTGGATGGPTAATPGSWEPAGTVDWGQLRLTVDLTKPVRARPLDNVRIGDYVGQNANQTGSVVDVDPLLGSGTYRCEGGDTLVLAPKEDGITWTLRRA